MLKQSIGLITLFCLLVLGTSSDPLATAGENNPPSVPKTTKAPPPPCQTCLVFLNDGLGRTNRQGNPIYTLEVYLNGQKIRAFKAVSGRAYTQKRNRHRSGTEAPLPDGRYRISHQIVPGAIPEVGGTFIPIYPKFSTGRTYLGIHYDPSFNRSNGEDGTEGCIALTNKRDRNFINRFVRTYRPQEIIVDLQ